MTPSRTRCRCSRCAPGRAARWCSFPTGPTRRAPSRCANCDRRCCAPTVRLRHRGSSWAASSASKSGRPTCGTAPRKTTPASVTPVSRAAYSRFMPTRGRCPSPPSSSTPSVRIRLLLYVGTDDMYLNYLVRCVKPGGPIGIAGAGLMQEIDGPAAGAPSPLVGAGFVVPPLAGLVATSLGPHRIVVASNWRTPCPTDGNGGWTGVVSGTIDTTAAPRAWSATGASCRSAVSLTVWSSSPIRPMPSRIIGTSPATNDTSAAPARSGSTAVTGPSADVAARLIVEREQLRGCRRSAPAADSPRRT